METIDGTNAPLRGMPLLSTVALRTVVFYFALLVVMRAMGKRELGALSPMDVVVAIMIAELAAIPIENTDIPMIAGMLPIALILVLEIGLSYLCLKSEWWRNLICGKPSIIIENGIIDRNEMRRQRYNIHDLLIQLRQAGIPNVADVEAAILEPTGDLSVIPKPAKRPLSPADLQYEPPSEGLPIMLITDGVVNRKSLKLLGKGEDWVEDLVRRHGISDTKEVFIGLVDSQGEIFFQAKDAQSKPTERGGPDRSTDLH